MNPIVSHLNLVLVCEIREKNHVSYNLELSIIFYEI